MTGAGAQRRGLVRAGEGTGGPRFEDGCLWGSVPDGAKKAAEKYSHGEQSFTE
jgi:hypothetical protein